MFSPNPSPSFFGPPEFTGSYSPFGNRWAWGFRRVELHREIEDLIAVCATDACQCEKVVLLKEQPYEVEVEVRPANLLNGHFPGWLVRRQCPSFAKAFVDKLPLRPYPRDLLFEESEVTRGLWRVTMKAGGYAIVRDSDFKLDSWALGETVAMMDFILCSAIAEDLVQNAHVLSQLSQKEKANA